MIGCYSISNKLSLVSHTHVHTIALIHSEKADMEMLTKTGEGVRNEVFSDGKNMLFNGCYNFFVFLTFIVASEY